MASLDHTLCLPLLFILIISTVHVLPASATRSHKLKNAITIREVNRRGPYIGLVTVFETEENAFLGSVDFRPDPAHPFLDLSGIYIIIYIYMLFLITATSWIDIFICWVFSYRPMEASHFEMCKCKYVLWLCEKNEMIAGRRFRIGKIHGKKVVYVRCGIGMVSNQI